MSAKSIYLEAHPALLPLAAGLSLATGTHSPESHHSTGVQFSPNQRNYPGAPSASHAPVLRGIIEDMVAGVFDIDADLLRQPTRGRAHVALARQVAMYIAHVGCSLSLTDVGKLFERDRTTVAHACSVVEQRRDDDSFDAAINLLDLVINVINGTKRAIAPATTTATHMRPAIG